MKLESRTVVLVPQGPDAAKLQPEVTLSQRELPADLAWWLREGGVMAWGARRRGSDFQKLEM